MEVYKPKPNDKATQGKLEDSLTQALDDVLRHSTETERGLANEHQEGSTEKSIGYIERIEREQHFSPETKAEGSLKRMEAEQEEDDYPYSRYAFRGLYEKLVQTQKPDAVTGIIRPEGYPDLMLTPQGDLVGPYKSVLDYLQEKGLTRKRGEEVLGFEAHHLLEKRLMEDLGISEDDGIAVAVYSYEHMELVHGKFGVDFQLERGNRFDIQDVIDGHTQAYQEMGRPEWADQVLQFLRKNKQAIIDAYASGKVTGAKPEDVRNALSYLRSI